MLILDPLVWMFERLKHGPVLQVHYLNLQKATFMNQILA